jgi:hypothetical protein
LANYVDKNGWVFINTWGLIVQIEGEKIK